MRFIVVLICGLSLMAVSCEEKEEVSVKQKERKSISVDDDSLDMSVDEDSSEDYQEEQNTEEDSPIEDI